MNLCSYEGLVFSGNIRKSDKSERSPDLMEFRSFVEKQEATDMLQYITPEENFLKTDSYLSVWNNTTLRISYSLNACKLRIVEFPGNSRDSRKAHNIIYLTGSLLHKDSH
jgi:hypothetical protein